MTNSFLPRPYVVLTVIRRIPSIYRMFNCEHFDYFIFTQRRLEVKKHLLFGKRQSNTAEDRGLIAPEQFTKQQSSDFSHKLRCKYCTQIFGRFPSLE